VSDQRRRELERLAKQGDPEALRRWALEQCRSGGEHLVDEATQRHVNRSAELMVQRGSNVEGLRIECAACGKLVVVVSRSDAKKAAAARTGVCVPCWAGEHESCDLTSCVCDAEVCRGDRGEGSSSVTAATCYACHEGNHFACLAPPPGCGCDCRGTQRMAWPAPLMPLPKTRCPTMLEGRQCAREAGHGPPECSGFWT
jgi:hypothetical protein